MKKFSTHTLLKVATAPAVLGFALLSGTAYAQDPQGADEAGIGEAIIVTGSRIARPEVETAAPITTVGAEEFALQAGSSNIENVLNDLPQVTATTSSTSNNPGGGVATVNLRNIGSSRTLVLVDGRRYVAYDVTQVVDLNTVPTALVERVDVVTGGRSAVYGSDAISGVVNFVTKKDFSGIEINNSLGITSRGDGKYWDSSITVGANLDDGRGNVMAHIGYLNRVGTYAGNRNFGRLALTNQAGNPPTLINAGSPSVPQTRVLLSSAQAGFAGSFFGTGTTTNLDFNSDGSLGAYVDTTDSYNFAPVNYLQVPQERFLISTSGHYEISPAVIPYIEAQFINNRVSTELAATPIGNSTPFGTGSLGALRVQAASTFLAPSVRAGLAAIDANETTSGLDVRGDGYVRLTSFGYRTVPLGPRQNNDDRNAFRILAGVRGDIGAGFAYDGYYMYARTRNSQRQNGNIAISNFIAATTTTFYNPNLPASAATSYSPTPWAGVAGGGQLVCADATARAAGCVPANIFGLGNVSQAAINYMAIGATNLQEYKTEVASFAITNPSLFDLGGGDVGLAVGAEWRREEGSVTPDQYLSSGNVAGFNPGRPTAGGYSVYEGFAELNVPIISDSFIHLLEVNAAGRVSNYSNAPGTVYTYAFGGVLSPVRDFTLRGQYSKAIRGPSVNELFLGNSVSFSGNIEGCGGATAAPGGSLYNFCLAQGIPASVLASATDRANLASATIVNPPTFIGGNPNLKEEEATTWTVGAVFQPSFFPGFVATLDYYDIKIDDYIGRATTANIGTGCFTYQLARYCDRIERNAVGQIERIVDPNGNNFLLKTSGVDGTVSYSHRFAGSDLRASISFTGSYLRTYNLELIGTPIINRCAGRFGRSCGAPTPKWRHNSRFSLGTDMLRGSVQWRYIGPATDDNPAATYAVERLPSKSYIDLSASISATENLDISMGASNVFDIDPPLLASAQSGGSGEQTNTFPTIYDVMGRSFFVNAKIRF